MATKTKKGEPAPESEIPTTAEASPPKPPDDGEAKTPAEPAPGTGTGKKRGPYKPRAGKAAGTSSSERAAAHALDPNLARMAAIGPMLIAGGIASRFFDTKLIYDPDQIEASQRLFALWMEEIGANLHPGIQYGIMAGVCIGSGILNSEPLTDSEKKAAAEMRAKAKADAKAKAEAHAAKANGTAPVPSAAPVPQDVRGQPEPEPHAAA